MRVPGKYSHEISAGTGRREHHDGEDEVEQLLSPQGQACTTGTKALANGGDPNFGGAERLFVVFLASSHGFFLIFSSSS